MKVTIEGDLEQVLAALEPVTHKPRAQKNESARARRNAVIRRQSDLLRNAFQIVRHNSAEKELTDSLLAALVRKSERTETILETARQIILSRQPQQSSREG